MKYLTKIYWSEDDNAYVAEVPALEGCISHGETLAEAAVNIQKAMEQWIRVAAKYNDPIPPPDRAMEEIGRFSPILNVSKLAKMAGINKSTLASKLRRRSAFSHAEGVKICRVLETV